MKTFYYFFFCFILIVNGLVIPKSFSQCPLTITANPTNATVCQGDTVILSALPNNLPTYKWYFNGTLIVDSTRHELVIYQSSKSGNYYVKTNTCAINSNMIYVTIKPKPNANFNILQPYSAGQCASLPIHFEAVINNQNYTYLWNFSDPPTSSIWNPIHEFGAYGGSPIPVNYNVQLSVTLNECSSSSSQQISVKEKPDATLNESVGDPPFSYCNSGENFTPIVTYPTPPYNPILNTLYHINWGIGTPYNSSSPPNSTPSPAPYPYPSSTPLIFTVTSINTCVTSKTYTVYNGSNPGVPCTNQGSTAGCAPLCLKIPIDSTIWMNNTISTKYYFVWGDGFKTIMYAPLPDTISHCYLSSSCSMPNHYFIITASAVNPCDSSFTNIGPIRVSNKPGANFSVPTTSLCAPGTVTFTNLTTPGCLSSNGSNPTPVYTWDFGGGTGDINATNPIVTFSTPGFYIITLHTQNPPPGTCGDSTISKTICISTSPESSFDVDHNIGCQPLVVNATGTSPTPDICSDIVYKWHVVFTGAGTCIPSSGAWLPGVDQNTEDASFTFNDPGTYTITYSISNSCGTATSTKTITVQAPPKVTITSDTDACVGQCYQPTADFSDCYANIDLYSWDFTTNGNPSTYNQPPPAPCVTYASTTGSPITITVSATNVCGTGTAQKNITVNNIPSVIPNPASQTLCTPGTTNISLTSNLVGTTFTWTATASSVLVGGYSNSSGLTISQTLTNSGSNIETVTYHITPLLGGCPGTPVDVIVYIKPAPSITTTPSSNQSKCSGDPLSIILTPSFPVPCDSITWTATGTTGISGFSDGAGCTINQTLINSKPDCTPGTVTYTIQGHANGCQGPDSTRVITVNHLPNLTTTPLNQRICSGEQTDINLTSCVAGTTFTWTCVSSSLMVTGYAAGVGTSIIQTLTNSGSNVETVTYNITPQATFSGPITCFGTVTNYVVTVNPRPTPTIISGSFIVNTLTPVTYKTQAGKSNYQWTISSGGTIQDGGGTSDDFVKVLWNTTITPQQICINYDLVNGGLSCRALIDNCYLVTVNPCPEPRTIIFDPSTGRFCDGEAGVTIGVENAENGIEYYVFDAYNSPVRGPELGQNLDFNFLPPIDISGIYTVHAINTASNCTIQLAPPIMVIKDPLPGIPAITPFGPMCANPPYGIELGLSGWEPGINYYWSLNGGGWNLSTGPPILTWAIYPGEYSAKAVDPSTMCESDAYNTVWIDSLPNKYNLYPFGDLCVCQDISLNQTQPDFEYTLINTRNPITNPPKKYGPADGGSITFEDICDEGRYRIIARDILNPHGTSCYDTMNYTLILHKNPIPYSIEPNESSCQPVHVYLSSSDVDVVYELKLNNTYPIRYRHGTGPPDKLDFGVLDFNSQEGTYTIIGRKWISNNTDSCETTMFGQIDLCKKPLEKAMSPSGPNPLCHVPIISVMNPDQSVTYTLLKNYMPIASATGIDPLDFHSSLIPPDYLPEFAPGLYKIKAIHECPTKSCDSTFGYLVIDSLPTVNAGPPDTTVCNVPPNTVNLHGKASSYSSVSWTSSSSGSSGFSDPTKLNATYTFNSYDLSNGMVTLTLTAYGTSGCSYSTVTDQIIIYIIMPEVDQPPNQVKCNNDPTDPVIFTTNVTQGIITYSWDNNNTSIGLAASGTGNIPSFIAVNTGNSLEIATIVVTPHFFNPATGFQCDGPSKSFTIIVNPSGQVNKPPDQVWCNGDLTTLVILTTNNTGGTTTYAWTNSDPSIGLPGAGAGNIPPFTAVNVGLSPVVATITITPTFNFGGKDCPGTPQTYTITVKPTPNPTISGQAPDACINVPWIYTTETGMSAYTWQIKPTGTFTSTLIGDGHSIEITWTQLGHDTIWVNYANIYGCTAIAPTALNVNVVNPPMPIVTSGPITPCVNSTNNTYTTVSGMTDYEWTVSAGGIRTGGGTSLDNFITVTWTLPGLKWVRVNYKGPAGCLGVTPTPEYSVFVIPLPTPTLTGDNSVCVNDPPITYTTEAGMFGYTWGSITPPVGQVMGGGTSIHNYIDVVWYSPGVHNVSVSYSNIYGCQAESPFLYPVTVHELPSVPSIWGDITVCQGDTNEYYTEAGMYDYTWGVTGTNTFVQNPENKITVTWSDMGTHQVMVNYKNSDDCYPPTPGYKTVTVNPVPIPVVTSGPTTVCDSSSASYSTISGQTNYIWTVDPPSYIESGQGTPNVTIHWIRNGISVHNLSVNYTSGICRGIEPTPPFTVTINAVPPPPVINGPESACVDSVSYVYSVEPGQAPYHWTISDGNIVSGGDPNDNTIELWWSTPGQKTIAVTNTVPPGSNGCSAITPGQIIVTVNLRPEPYIIGPNSSCKNDTLVYSTQSSMTNYSWAVSTGGTIMSGANSPSVTVKWTTVGAQSISINFTNSNGCEAANRTDSTVVVHPIPVPIITGDSIICLYDTIVYYTQSGMNNYTWTIQGGIIVSGLQTNTVTVVWITTGAQWIKVNYTNSNGCDAVSPTKLNITVNSLPTPTITGPATACVDSVSYTYTSESGNPPYFWTYPGGTRHAGGMSNDDFIELSWNSPGQKTITVDYTNSNGCTALNPTEFELMVNVLPEPYIVGPDSVCQDDIVEYSTQTGMSDYFWYVSSGGVIQGGSNTTNPIFVKWNNTGVQTVSVNFTNENNCLASHFTDSVVIVHPKPNPVIYGQQNAICEATGGWEYSTIPGQFFYQWSTSPGGKIDSGQGTNKIYVTWLQNGPQSVQVYFQNSFGCDSLSNPHPVNVTGRIEPIINGQTSSTIFSSCTDSINNVYTAASGKDLYSWHISGGVFTPPPTPTNNLVTVAWGSTGPYWISVNYETSDSCRALSDTLFNVDVRPRPNASFFIKSAEFCVDSTIIFKDTSAPYNGSNTTWQWIFGDGTPDVKKTISDTVKHTYITHGSNYLVTLKVMNSNGCTDTVSIRIPMQPCIMANYTYDKLSSCARYNMLFNDSSTNHTKITKWTWDWNDPYKPDPLIYNSYQSFVTHTFDSAGTYNVKLTVEMSGPLSTVTDSYTKIITIQPTPLPGFLSAGLCQRQVALFTDTSKTFDPFEEDSISRIWYFRTPAIILPDDTSHALNPTHVYDKPGQYDVKLFITNKYGCSDSVTKRLRVHRIPEAKFSSTNACSGNPAIFTDESIKMDTTIIAWQWNFGDKETNKDTSVVQNPIYQYDSAKDYNVLLRITDGFGCCDTATSLIDVKTSPVSAFTYTDNLNGMTGKIQLNNLSSGAISYEWEFGNGSSSTEENPIATYNMDGTYVITLVSLNQFNCTDTTYYKYEVLFKGLYVPNAFSPTNTNLALRLFKPVGINMKKYNIQVYDYLGHMLWESAQLDSEGGPLEGWDGTFNGVLMPQGTYMWKASAVFIDDTIWQGSDIGNGEVNTMGTVSLIR